MGMSRRQIRENIFQLLFRADFYPRDELEGQIGLGLDRLAEMPFADDAAESVKASEPVGTSETDDLAETLVMTEKDSVYIREKISDILAHLDEIDAAIDTAAEGWKTGRMAKAELAILRLAVYEMRYEDDMPVSVAINEAVELAKIYGSDKGASFVNGVLGKLA